MVDQEKIHNQCISNDPKERIEGLRLLEDNFSLMPDKEQAWSDLIKLTNDRHWQVRSSIASTLYYIFCQIPDKQKAWDHLVNLTDDQSRAVRSSAAFSLHDVFSLVPDKNQAWDDLNRLANHKDSDVSSAAASSLVSASYQTTDKQKVWNDLVKLANNESSLIRYLAAEALDSVFPYVSDKQQAWNDLHKLAADENSFIRSSVTSVIGLVFSHIPNKQEAWNDLHRLTIDEDSDVKSNAACSLGLAFSYIPDKQEAWNDLIKLTTDENEIVKQKVAETFDSVFSHVPDKQQAWNDLHKLADDKDYFMRCGVVSVLGTAYSQLPDKQQAWNDLIRLTSDRDYRVRSMVASSFGTVYSMLPNKQRAFKDLIKLTNDRNRNVRAYAMHSVGKIAIFNASQAEKEEDYRKELEKAITFFEAAAIESNYEWYNPSKFCLPFYRSFHAIIFKKQKANSEVDKYLTEAKIAVKDSKTKELLFETVNNLSNALKEVQNLENLDLKAMKEELNLYRRYCDHAEELLRDLEDEAPFATIAMKKGMFILDRNLKELLEKIQNKAKVACKEAKGTATEEITYSVCREVQKWEIGSQEEMTQKVEDIAYLLKMKIADLPENRYLLNKIEAMKHERNVAKQYDALLFVIGQIPTMKVISEQELDQKLQKFDRIFDEIICVKDKLNCISFDVSKTKLNSANVISDLKTIKAELEKLSKVEGLNTLSIEKLDSVQAEKLNGFDNNILGRLDEIKILIHELSKDNNEICEEYSRRLDELKQSKLDTLLQRYSAVISLIGFVISGISIAH